jgi:hypothetical protein
MLESEKYGFHGPPLAVSTVFLAVVAVFTFGLAVPTNIGMPTVTVLHKFVVSAHPGFAPLLMPKLAPKTVMVAAVFQGADGAVVATAVLVPPIDEIVGAEYITAAVIVPVSCLEPQETTPVLAVLMPPRRPCGILTRIAVSEIQTLRLVAVSPTLERAVLALPKDDPLT